mmetsp:Transcript_14186/g.26695  ORF Transcript_14186/g.26695 Transcript_14186/m.26695 type:complete len:150 (-) Transcript_14186:3075-3524(-)
MSDASDSDFVPDEVPEPEKPKTEAAKEAWSSMKEEKAEVKPALTIAEVMRDFKKVEPAKVQVEFAGEAFELTPPLKRNKTLDTLMEQLTRKKQVNTITKSVLDWEKYKTESGLEDALSRNRKDGFLPKVSFLDRCAEREKQLRKRQKRS